MRDFFTFAVFAAALFAAILSGVVTWIFDEVLLTMDVGDFATWFTGFATTAVAILAWRTAHNSARIAKAAYIDQLRGEAANVTWWFEEAFADINVMADPSVRSFVLPDGILPWESSPEVSEVSAFAIIRVVNANPHLIGNAQILMDHHTVEASSAGLQPLGILRPGTTRFWACIWEAGGSERSVWSARARLIKHEYAASIEFSDSEGRRWRRWADGTLEGRDTKVL